MEQKPLKTLKLKFAELRFFESFVVSTVNDNLILDEPHIEEMKAVCHEFYGGRFVYISNRTTDYNVNPIVYLNINKSNYLAGIAVVAKDPFSIDIAYFEKKFSKLPFEVFFEMEDAQEWAEDLIKNKKADL